MKINPQQIQEEAIKAAMEGNWKKAIDLNKKLIMLSPRDTAAHNRLARAHWEDGDLNKARKIFGRVLEIDAYNLIAQKNLKRIADQKKTGQSQKVKKVTNANIFLEEPGKTKLVKLVRLASPHTLSEYDCGDEVRLQTKKRCISVYSCDDVYLGNIPDDLSRYLMTLIKKGNDYRAHIKVVDRQHLEILIRETKRSNKLQHRPSFG